jgi:hypothetical protein
MYLVTGQKVLPEPRIQLVCRVQLSVHRHPLFSADSLLTFLHEAEGGLDRGWGPGVEVLP